MSKTPAKIAPAEARAMFLAALRSNNHTALTSEIAFFTTLPVSVVRRCGLKLVSENKVAAVLVPGRGKGEYRFTITQLDLFESKEITRTSFWQTFRKILGF